MNTSMAIFLLIDSNVNNNAHVKDDKSNNGSSWAHKIAGIKNGKKVDNKIIVLKKLGPADLFPSHSDINNNNTEGSTMQHPVHKGRLVPPQM